MAAWGMLLLDCGSDGSESGLSRVYPLDLVRRKVCNGISDIERCARSPRRSSDKAAVVNVELAAQLHQFKHNRLSRIPRP